MDASSCMQLGVHTVTQSSPSPTISGIYNIPSFGEVSRISSADSGNGGSSYSSEGSGSNKVLKDVHISAQLLEDFLALAKENTDKDMETCGVLGAFLSGGTYYVTTLIIPKQESTSSSCHALNEEEIFAIQNEQSLIPVGWIHTHPSQTCFMSSVDLHTQFSYQIMVPEAVAIVMAPTDNSRLCQRKRYKLAEIKAAINKPYGCWFRKVEFKDLETFFPPSLQGEIEDTKTWKNHSEDNEQVPHPYQPRCHNNLNYGIYRLSEPDGVTILMECQEKGFHIHREPSDGRPIYEHCSNVYVNPTLRFEIFDLR